MAHVRDFFYVSHHIFMADPVDGAETKSVMCLGITGCGGRVFLFGRLPASISTSAWFSVFLFFWASFCILGGRSSGQPGIDREHVKSKFTFIGSSAISHFFCVCAISGQLFWNFLNVCERGRSFLTSITTERNMTHHSRLLFPLQFSWLFLPWLCCFHSHYIIDSVLLILIHVNICYF